MTNEVNNNQNLENQENEVNNNNVHPNTDENNNTNEDNSQKENEKLFTQEQLDEILNKKFAKWKKKQEDEIEEAKRKEKMTAEELLAEERKKFEAERKEFEHMKQVRNVTNILADKGLPVAFADFLVAADEEQTNSRLQVFEKAFNDAVGAAVADRFKKQSPKASNTDANAMTREQFKKLNLFQQAEIAQKDPQLYAELTK